MEDYSDWEIVEDQPNYNDWEEVSNAFNKPNFLNRTDRKGAAGVGEDVAEGIYDFVTGIPQGLETIGKGVGYGAGQAQENPKRFSQNLLGSLGEYGAQIANIPSAAHKYGESRGLENSSLEDFLWEQAQKAFAGSNKPSPMTKDENAFQRAWRSIHLPKPGEFNYAEGLGQGPASFPEEAEADTLAKQLLPGLYSAAGGVPGMMLQQLGAEENPFGPLAIPALTKTIKTAGKLEKEIPKIPGKIKKGFENITPDWLTKEKAGKTVGEPAKALKQELSGEYENIKTDLRSKGIKGNTKEQITRTTESAIIDPETGKPIKQTTTSLEAPSLEKITKDLKGMNDKTVESVHKAFESGDIGDLINAEKDIGLDKNNKLTDYWEKDIPLDRNAIHRAAKVEKKIDGIISDMLKRGNPLEANRLIDLRRRYHQELGPFLDIAPIARYIEGDLTAADLTRKLQGNTVAAERFRATLADKYKAIGGNKLKNKLIELGFKGGTLSTLMKIAGSL